MPLDDIYVPGDYNASCFECGRKFKASQLFKHWQGYYVCREHWESRHPQDYVRSTTDDISVPWAQPESDIFAVFCTPDGISAYADLAVADCCRCDLLSIFNTPTPTPAPAPTPTPSPCSTNAVAGEAEAGCVVAGDGANSNAVIGIAIIGDAVIGTS